MLRLFSLLFFALVSLASSATPHHDECAKILYPSSNEDQVFVSKFFEILELHKTQDPLLEGKGPSVAGFSLDKMKFAFMINRTSTTVDLAFFNWKLEVIKGMQKNERLSKAYGSTVYILKSIPKIQIASQGENHDQLTNFSYLHGSDYFAAQARLSNPNAQIPEAFAKWKPHPQYMDHSHPLRKALGTQVLILLAPEKELLFDQILKNTRAAYEEYLKSKGGYINVILGMMIHESFHVKVGEDNVNGLADKRDIPEDRKALVKQIESDPNLRTLFATYAKVVFSIGDALKKPNITTTEVENLKDLSSVITELKTKYPNAWSFIWNYEYTEGFAEYVSAFSMIQGRVTTQAGQIDLQKTDTNNFAYRTGAIGGLYLANRTKDLPFKQKEDHHNSLWELILKETKTQKAQNPINTIIKKYNSIPFDQETELKDITEYLISTEIVI